MNIFTVQCVQIFLKGKKQQDSIWKVYGVFEVSVWFSLVGAITIVKGIWMTSDTNF